ncbi:MAG: portal protein, partial [Bacteroidota bacterium]
MAIEEIRREETAEGRRTQILDYVRELKAHSEQHFTSIRKEFPQLYDLYRGTLSGKYTPHRNNVHIPLIFSTIQSDVARKTQASFGGWPAVSFIGYSPEDAPIARKREALIGAQMKDAQSFIKAYDLFLTGDLYGTAVAQWGWCRKDQNMQISYMDVLPVTGESVQIAETRRVTMFDGPDWKVWDPLDCFPQPGVREIAEMGWFITREYLDLDVVRMMSEVGPGDRSVFDRSEVQRMEREGGGDTRASDDYKNWRNMGRNLMDQDARLKEQHARVIEIWTFWGRLPRELAPDGIVDRVITVANERYILRNRPNPFWNGKKPLLQYSPMPDPHYFWAPGKAEVAKKLQIVANRFTNQQLDALDLFIDPVFFHHSDAGLNTDSLYIRPGKWIETDIPPSEAIMPLIPNLSGVQMGGQMTEVLWR